MCVHIDEDEVGFMIRILGPIFNHSKSSSNLLWSPHLTYLHFLLTAHLLFGLPLSQPHCSSEDTTTKNGHSTLPHLELYLHPSNTGSSFISSSEDFFYFPISLRAHTYQYITISIFDLSILLCIPLLSVSSPAFIILSLPCPTIPHSTTVCFPSRRHIKYSTFRLPDHISCRCSSMWKHLPMTQNLSELFLEQS